MYVRAALCHARFDSRRAQVEFFCQTKSLPKTLKAIDVQREEEEALSFVVSFFSQRFAFVCVPITCEVLVFLRT